MSNPFQSYTSEIVARLTKMERAQSRAWFHAIRGYIERQTGRPVASIHDYITAAPGKDDLAADGRPVILHAVVAALRADDLSALSGSPAESSQVVPFSPSASSPLPPV